MQDTETFEQHSIVCNNLPGLIERVIEERQLIDDDSLMIKIGLDGGGEFMKVCLSVFNVTEPSTSKAMSLAKKFKNSGVKKCILLAIVPDIPENHTNVKRLWLTLKMETMTRHFTIATDLKLCNILLGLMTHSCTHPCCWCDIDKDHLCNRGKTRLE
jgi:hypothetical protein